MSANSGSDLDGNTAFNEAPKASLKINVGLSET